MKLFCIFTFVLFSGEVALAKSFAKHPMIGETTLKIFIGEKLFNDKVFIARDKSGKLYGKLTVPKAFTAPLEKIELHKDRFSFEIEADEGRGPFRVRYEGEIHPSGKVYKGFAVLPLKNNKLLGGFVGSIK